MAGQRTRIRFGSVSAEVLLEKTSTKPRAAQHETRRVLVDATPAPTSSDPIPEGAVHVPPAGTSAITAPTAPTVDAFGDPVDVSGMVHEVGQREPLPERIGRPGQGPLPPMPESAYPPDAEPLPSGLLGPMGDPTWPPPHAREPVAFDSAEHEPQRQPVAAPRPGDFTDDEREEINPAAPTYVPPATRVEQGVHLEDGTWVDLTDRLDAIDQRTRVDGLEVVRTIPASSYASERVREAHYLCGVDPYTFKVLALLWRALRSERMAAEVRWTKRTAQASGIIVARGELPTAERPKPATPAHLLLLELEWHAQIKRVPPRARGPITADVAVDELVAATELVQSFAAPAPREELRDERLAKRAELLELARAGKLAEYVPPAEPMPEDLDTDAEDFAAALRLAAGWNRAHAPA